MKKLKIIFSSIGLVTAASTIGGLVSCGTTQKPKNDDPQSKKTI